MRVAGIMSGTSLDGIDVAIVDIGRKIQTVAHQTTAYPAEVRTRILAVTNTTCHSGLISRLNFELGELYAKAVLQTCKRRTIPLESIDLIASRGGSEHLLAVLRNALTGAPEGVEVGFEK